MKRITIIVLLLLRTYIFSKAQNTDRNTIGMTVGITDRHLLDEHASALIYSGMGFVPSLQYSHNSEVGRHVLEATFFYNQLNSAQDNFIATNYSGRLRYSYSHLLNFITSNSKFKLFCGGSVCTFFNKTNYDYRFYAISWARAISSWYWRHSLDLTTRLEYSHSPKNIFSIDLNIPILSNVSRPQYSPSADYNYITNTWDVKIFGKTVLFPDNLAFDLNFNYQRLIYNNLKFKLNYELEYARYNSPKLMKMYMSNLSVGFCYNI